MEHCPIARTDRARARSFARDITLNMADGISRARELLAQAVQFLGGSTPQPRDSDPRGPPPSATSVSNRSSLPSSPRSASASVPRSRVSTSLAERSCLFNCGKRSNKNGESRAKSTKKRRVALWNHEFVCLSDMDQDRTPSAYDGSRLLAAGM